MGECWPSSNRSAAVTIDKVGLYPILHDMNLNPLDAGKTCSWLFHLPMFKSSLKIVMRVTRKGWVTLIKYPIILGWFWLCAMCPGFE